MSQHILKESRYVPRAIRASKITSYAWRRGWGSYKVLRRLARILP